jgi:hypothetical protein
MDSLGRHGPYQITRRSPALGVLAKSVQPQRQRHAGHDWLRGVIAESSLKTTLSENLNL